jgi:hypothetical protein
MIEIIVVIVGAENFQPLRFLAGKNKNDFYKLGT